MTALSEVGGATDVGFSGGGAPPERAIDVGFAGGGAPPERAIDVGFAGGGASPERAIDVRFAGGRSGRGPLTWGQRAIWHAIGKTAPDDHYFNFGRVLAVPARIQGADAGRVAEALGLVIGRLEALRTRLAFVDGEPYQDLHSAGRLPLEIVAATAEQAADVAERLRERLAATAFDYADEWPLRAGVITVDGTAGHVVLVFCHMAVDGHGADLVVRDLRLALLRGTAGRAPESQPLDLARWQHSPDGRRAGQAALDFWADGLRRIPPTMFASPVAAREAPPFWSGLIVSRAMDVAVRVVADRYRTSGSTVLLAASAALVGAVTGHRTCAIMPIVGNRFTAGSRDLVSTLSHDGLFVVDVDPAATFGELVPAAWQASLRAYRYGSFDPVAWENLIAQVSAERGTAVHPYCCFNDMRLVEQAGRAFTPPDEAELRAARGGTTFAWAGKHERVDCRFCLHVTAEPGGLGVRLTADTGYLPAGMIEGYLRGMETLLVEAAYGEVRLADVAAMVDSP